MENNMVMMIGKVKFNVIDAPREFGKKTVANIQKLDRINGPTSLQGTGSEPDTYNFTYELHSRIHGARIKEKAEALDKICKDNEVVYLMGGDGSRYGKVMIKESGWKVIKTTMGIPIHIEGVLTIWEFSE